MFSIKLILTALEISFMVSTGMLNYLLCLLLKTVEYIHTFGIQLLVSCSYEESQAQRTYEPPVVKYYCEKSERTKIA